MMHFDEWWNSAAADSFRAKHEDLDGEVFRTVWDAAQLGQAAIKKAEGTALLNWLDAQVKNHAVYNGFLWQECGGWEGDRGLVCAIQDKKQKKTVRQAIYAAIAAQAKQGERL